MRTSPCALHAVAVIIDLNDCAIVFTKTGTWKARRSCGNRTSTRNSSWAFIVGNAGYANWASSLKANCTDKRVEDQTNSAFAWFTSNANKQLCCETVKWMLSNAKGTEISLDWWLKQILDDSRVITRARRTVKSQIVNHWWRSRILDHSPRCQCVIVQLMSFRFTSINRNCCACSRSFTHAHRCEDTWPT